VEALSPFSSIFFYVEVYGERDILSRITAFEKCNALIISIPNNVEKIEDMCFSYCESLCGVFFQSESKLKEIDHSTFGSTSFFRSSVIKSVRIPNNVEKIGNYCFCECISLCDGIHK
jgi:hypothetical protein